jgi:hypothetical protein
VEPTLAFCTLGVYVSPSGNQQKQLEMLRSYSTSYHDAIQYLTSNSSEAYLSYFQYLQPKLWYPHLCTSLSPNQCRMIQSPALATLLPKLH